jgi:hypothetical protein
MMRSSICRDVSQRRAIVTDVSGQPVYPIFMGQAVPASFLGSLNMGWMGFLEKSVTKYKSILRNVSRERISHLHSSESLQSSKLCSL